MVGSGGEQLRLIEKHAEIKIRDAGGGTPRPIGRAERRTKAWDLPTYVWVALVLGLIFVGVVTLYLVLRAFL